MALSHAPVERKVIRRESFKLTDKDVFLLQQLSGQIALAESILDNARQAHALAQNNVTNLLGVTAIERWDFPEGADVRFSEFDLDKKIVTVEELEPTDDPKEETGDENSSESAIEAGPENEASDKTDAEAGNADSGDEMAYDGPVEEEDSEPTKG